MGTHVTQVLPVKPLTAGPKHHYFGYYEKCPWDATQRYLLGMEIGFIDRQPKPDDALTLGLIDTAEGSRFTAFDQTLAWNWQQGCMLQWLPEQADTVGNKNLPGPARHCVIYNQREGDQFVAVIRDVVGGGVRKLARPIYAVDPKGRYALSLNFGRLAVTRPGYGYEGVPDAWAGELQPKEDGLYRIDLRHGGVDRIFSTRQAYELQPGKPNMKDAKMWFNHIQINTDGSRFAVLNRWQVGKSWHTRCLTMNPDGSEPYVLTNDEYYSHYDWRSPTEILAHCSVAGKGRGYFLLTDRSGKAEAIGADVFQTDGHCSFSPDRKWVLTDTYPDKEQKRTLILYEWATGKRIDIGRFYAPPELGGPLRVDLHPRWSRDGKQVCFDSAHDKMRQMYGIEVGAVVGG